MFLSTQTQGRISATANQPSKVMSEIFYNAVYASNYDDDEAFEQSSFEMEPVGGFDYSSVVAAEYALQLERLEGSKGAHYQAVCVTLQCEGFDANTSTYLVPCNENGADEEAIEAMVFYKANGQPISHESGDQLAHLSGWPFGVSKDAIFPEDSEYINALKWALPSLFFTP